MNSNKVIYILLFAILLLSSLFLIHQFSVKKILTGNVIGSLDLSNNSYSEFDKRNNTLILYNENYLYGKDIAEYYANARNISLSRTCGVKMPVGSYISGNELKGARREVIDECLCRVLNETLPLASRPVPCNVSNINLIANLSPITHLVFTIGMPSRLYNTGWVSDLELPPADYYLSVALYSDKNIFNLTFGSDNEIFDFNQGYKPYRPSINTTKWLQSTSSMYGYVRAINVSLDKMPAFGRVEAIDFNRTKALIDRTMAAERNGISGNFLTNLDGVFNIQTLTSVPTVSDPTYLFLSELVSNNATLCNQYIINASSTWNSALSSNSYGSWNYTYCRSGASLDGNLPGEPGPSGGLPKAYDVGLYLGNNAGPNGQSGFDGFSTIENWRINSSDCTYLCEDLPTSQQVDDCKSKSKDYGHDLNTECVGGNPGLIGFQLRSYPVANYGHWPRYWGSMGGSATIPKVMKGNSYKNSRYSDDNFIRLGSTESVSNVTCADENYTLSSCYEKIAIALELYRPIYLSPVGSRVNHTFIFRYRSDPINNGKLFTVGYIIYFTNSSGTSWYKSNYYLINMSSDGNNWSEVKNEIYLNRSDILLLGNVNFTGMVIDFFGDFIGQDTRKFIDFDGVEAKDNIVGNYLSPLESSSFNATGLTQVTYGDYAFNAIDRLGGIGWWGSSSHFLTGGFAYSNQDAFLGAFISGRTLGESLEYTGAEYSGMVYADPLYSPAGVKIYLSPRVINGAVPQINGGRQLANQSISFTPPYEFSVKDNNLDAFIQINAFQGRGKNQTTLWTLEKCNFDKYVCMDSNNWSEIVSGQGGAYGLSLPVRLIDLVNLTNTTQNITLKLRVWNIGEEKNDLVNYASFIYKANISSNYIIGNITRFRGIVGKPIMYVDGDRFFDQNQNRTGVALVSFVLNGTEILNFTHDFSIAPLNLTSFDILFESTPINYLIVKNLSILGGKTLAINNVTGSYDLCYLNSEVSNVSQLIDNCVDISCPGSRSGVSCSVKNSLFVIKGLSYSGVLQHNYVAPNNNSNISNSSTSNPSSNEGGGGFDNFPVTFDTSNGTDAFYPDSNYPEDYAPATNSNDPFIDTEIPGDLTGEKKPGSNLNFLILIIVVLILLSSSIMALILIYRRKKYDGSGDINVRMLDDYINQGLYELTKGNRILADEIYQKTLSMYSYYKLDNSDLKEKIAKFFDELNKS